MSSSSALMTLRDDGLSSSSLIVVANALRLRFDANRSSPESATGTSVAELEEKAA